MPRTPPCIWRRQLAKRKLTEELPLRGLKNGRTEELKNGSSVLQFFSSLVLPFFRPVGFTLVELLIGAALLVIGIVTMLAVLTSQSALNEQARNASWALNDATRVMERIRQQNSGAGCAAPSAAAPGGFADWDAWLADESVNGGGGKSVQPDPDTNELMVVGTSGSDPLTVTVSVCWRQRDRTVGECAWDDVASALSADESMSMVEDTAAIDSPVMLSTVMTCRE